MNLSHAVERQMVSYLDSVLKPKKVRAVVTGIEHVITCNGEIKSSGIILRGVEPHEVPCPAIVRRVEDIEHGLECEGSGI